jgi:DNA-binding transcriptional LysR family regulator
MRSVRASWAQGQYPCRRPGYPQHQRACTCRSVGGLGIAFLPEEKFAPFIAEGRLISVLADWYPAFFGYHIYYPSRRPPNPAFSLVLEALRGDPSPG